MCTKILPTINKNVTSKSTTATDFPATDWMPSIGAKYANVVLNLTDSTTNLKVRAKYQLAETHTDGTADPDPRPWKEFSATYLEADGWLLTQLTDISSGTQGTDESFWIRFGLEAINSTGSAMERGQVMMTVALRA